MLQITAHRFIGQLRAVRAVAMVTGIYSQHLTGQRTVRKLGTGGKEPTERKQKTFLSVVSFFLATAQKSDNTNKGCIVHTR